MIRPDLKRCPFCGGRANMWSYNHGTRIDCENWQSGHFIGIEAATPEEAEEIWNRRIRDHEQCVCKKD